MGIGCSVENSDIAQSHSVAHWILFNESRLKQIKDYHEQNFPVISAVKNSEYTG